VKWNRFWACEGGVLPDQFGVTRGDPRSAFASLAVLLAFNSASGRLVDRRGDPFVRPNAQGSDLPVGSRDEWDCT
jgi:hypothetical protein